MPEAVEAPAGGTAAAVNAAIHAAEDNMTLRDHLMRLGLWAIVSLNVGVFFSQGDEGAQILERVDDFAALIIDPQTGGDALERTLERVARGLAQNDSLKMRLLCAPGVFERLVAIVQSGDAIGATSRNHAAKALEAMSGSASTQREMVARGHHETLLRVMRADGTSLYAQKTLAATVCNLAALAENTPALARAGAVGALAAEQAVDPRLVRQRVGVSISRLAASADALGDDVTASLPPAERELIATLAAEERTRARESFMHEARATLVESGVLLYLHTAGGGAAWGLFESLRSNQPRSMLVQNVARTALVTCFVPILMVGGVVTAYHRVNKATDSISEKFALYFGICVGLYPAQRLLSWVERFAPLWLGGHIVGFGSFFVYTLVTESDLLKSDAALLAPAPAAKPPKKKLVVLWEAKKEPPPQVPTIGTADDGTAAAAAASAAPPAAAGPMVGPAPRPPGK